MKICVVNSTVFAVGNNGLSGYGGLEQLAWQQAKGLASKGHEVSLVSPDDSTCPGVTIIPTGTAGKHDEKQAYSKYWQELPKFDAIVDHSWNKWSYILKMEGRLKCPILGVCHAPVNTMFGFLPPIEKSCFVCISEDQRRHFEEHFGRKARTARNGIDLDFYKPIRIPRNSRYLFLARFSTIKGPDLAIEACKSTNKELDLIGDTSITNEPDFLEKCKKETDGNHIKFVGPATRGECVYWFSQNYCLLHPNQRFREPLGLAPLENQACESPVIAWDYGALRETVIHGETGFLVNYLDDLKELLKTDAVSTINRKRCRENASQFSEQKMIDRYEELIIEAVETGGW